MANTSSARNADAAAERAIAAFFPRLELTATADFESAEPGRLFQ